MTDLELTTLCAEAMGFSLIHARSGSCERVCQKSEPGCDGECEIANGTAWWLTPEIASFNKNKPRDQPPYGYDPLNKDAQAMALVKKFRLNIFQSLVLSTVVSTTEDMHYSSGAQTDLNYAICVCVAKMQKAKVTT